MPLEPDEVIGTFKIIEPLGSGGMGEVYRARDSGLKRDVAIKMLPDSLAEDQDRVQRFEREARLLASLNHPNVGAIHGLERNNGLLFLVLELVPGDTLTDREERGPMPLRETLVLFQQVASALEAAHTRGIVHRDLKPDNIKITPEDVVKVLDFGLAKELAEELAPGGTALDNTKTAPNRLTRIGDVLGTPAYMSPEQWAGQSADKRTDIWSFGVCLFEALAGRHPFSGKTVSDVMMAVTAAEPDFGLLPGGVPRNINNLLRRCLRRELRRRLHDISDARIEIEEALERLDQGSGQDRPYLKTAAFAAAALAAGLALGALFPNAPAPAPVRRFTIEVPPTEPVALGGGPALALSRDGSRLVYSVRRGESTELQVRPIGRLVATRLAGTDGARSPFFSSDSDSLGYFADGRLWRLKISDLSTEPGIPAESPRGGSWVDGRLVVAPHTMGGLVALTSASGAALEVTELLESDRSHRWPSLLPGGAHALFTSWSGEEGVFAVEAVELATGERLPLLSGGSFARFAPSLSETRGHLVFLREGSLWAVPFDAGSVTLLDREPVRVVEDVYVDELTGGGFFDFSMEGTLVYAPRDDVADEGSGQLLRVDRQGDATLIVPAASSYQVPRLSPDGSQILVTITDEDLSSNVWRYDEDRAFFSRETTKGIGAAAIWHPDGRFTFSSDRDGGLELYLGASGASDDAERLTFSPELKFPNSWSPDGSTLAYTVLSSSSDIYFWDRETRRSEPFLATDFEESAAAFSPDGGYIAYVSNESGREEVYVSSVRSGKKGEQVSTGGGKAPVWGGNELFYREGAVMMAVDYVRDPSFRPGKARALFEAPYDDEIAPYANYSVSRDGTEFIMVRSNRETSATRLLVVLGWFEELKQRAPIPR